MDLSNLRHSLREDEASTLRRARHLRSSEDELSAVFRSAATSLTTLYRQGVASNKASYETGYAHALAHVLELWDNDRDWLKGYLQRRIEALENDGEDDIQPIDDEAVNAPAPVVRPSDVGQARQSVKRSRSRSHFSGPSPGKVEEEQAAERRLHKLPTPAKASTSAFHTNTGFNFSTPLAYPPHGTTSRPVSSKSPIGNSNSNSNGNGNSTNVATSVVTSGGVIRTSNAATSRRRLQRLKGLRAGRDRVIQVERPTSAQDEMVDQSQDEDANAWTDDDDDHLSHPDPPTCHPNSRKKLVAWTERSHPTSSAAASTAMAATSMDLDSETKVLERTDRRKRRKASRKLQAPESHQNTTLTKDNNNDEFSTSLDEDEFLAYHS